MGNNKEQPESVGYGLEFMTLVAVFDLKGEGYGLTIQEEVKALSNKEVSLGALYNTLERLKAKGFVETSWGEATKERGGKRKLHYKVTGLGEIALTEALEEQRRVASRLERLEPATGFVGWLPGKPMLGGNS